MTDPTSARILAATLCLLLCSPVLWGGWKMLVNHLYYKRFRREQDEIMADPDAVRRMVRLTVAGPPNPPY